MFRWCCTQALDCHKTTQYHKPYWSHTAGSHWQHPCQHFRLQDGRRRHTHEPCRAAHLQAWDLAAVIGGQVSVQEFLVAAAVVGAASASFFLGIKGEPVICDLCQGTGGANCFACGATGQGRELDAEEFRRQKRDFVGRVTDPSKCRVCGGSGRTFCSKCKGTGYMKRL